MRAIACTSNRIFIAFTQPASMFNCNLSCVSSASTSHILITSNDDEFRKEREITIDNFEPVDMVYHEEYGLLFISDAESRNCIMRYDVANSQQTTFALPSKDNPGFLSLTDNRLLVTAVKGHAIYIYTIAQEIEQQYKCSTIAVAEHLFVWHAVEDINNQFIVCHKKPAPAPAPARSDSNGITGSDGSKKSQQIDTEHSDISVINADGEILYSMRESGWLQGIPTDNCFRYLIRYEPNIWLVIDRQSETEKIIKLSGSGESLKIEKVLYESERGGELVQEHIGFTFDKLCYNTQSHRPIVSYKSVLKKKNYCGLFTPQEWGEGGEQTIPDERQPLATSNV